MAAQTVSKARCYHGTTSPGATPDKVTLTHVGRFVVIENRSATDDLWITFDGATNPTVNGDDCYIVPSGSVRSFSNRQKAITAIWLMTPTNAVVYSVESM